MKKFLKIRSLRRWFFRGALAAVLLMVVGWFAAPALSPKLENRDHRLPSVVYAAPMVLAPDTGLTRGEVLDQLKRRRYKQTQKEGFPEGLYRVSGNALIVHRRPFTRGRTMTLAETLRLQFDGDDRLVRIENGRGQRLDRDVLEPDILGRLYGSYWHDRSYYDLDDYPKQLITALLEVEDRRFYEHHGLDFRRIAGAFVANVKSGGRVQGGSTITQQLVKNLYLSQKRSYWRKAKEAVLALLIERRHQKDTILTVYVNEVYLGQYGPVAVHGIGQAARHYFGKHPHDLTLSESAFLVGLIQAPGKHSPHRNLEGARERRNQVLQILYDRGAIGEKAYHDAASEPLSVLPPPKFELAAPFVTAHVRKQLESTYSEEMLEKNGYQIHTSIDARLQRIAEAAVTRQLEALEKSRPRLRRKDHPLQAAVVALSPRGGEVRALVGGREFSQSQFDRATQAKRQPGSSFKPMVALTALTDQTQKPRITLATFLDDSPLHIKTSNGTWTPENADRKHRGPVTLREALEKSLNVPMARLGVQLTPRAIVATAQRAGIHSDLEAVPSLALGASEVSLLELTRAYATLAGGGSSSEPAVIQSLQTATNQVIKMHDPHTTQRFTPAETFVVTAALEGVVDHGTARRLRALGYEGAVAGKTGTSNDNRDAWFIGYTPELVIGVWVGFDDGTPTGLAGSSAALPIFADIIQKARLDPDAEFVPPPGVETVEIEHATGRRAGFGCGDTTEYFLAGTAPTERCEGEQWAPVRSVFDFVENLFGNP